MRTELTKAAEAIRQAESFLAACKKKTEVAEHLDELEEMELGLKWILKKIARILKEGAS